MSLATANWKYVGTASFASGTVHAVLTAVHTLGTAVTYADTTARTPGSGSAWTWQQYLNGGAIEAEHANPPTDTLAQRVILAGQASGGVKTPTMAAPDTAATVPSVVPTFRTAAPPRPNSVRWAGASTALTSALPALVATTGFVGVALSGSA